jgi:alanine racemase
VTFGIPGRAAPGPGTPGRTAPVARIARSALDLNLRAVLSSTRSAVIDVRADAWGHGLAFVATAALRSGAAGLLVDDGGAAELVGTIDPALLMVSGEATAPEAVYGLTAGFTPVLSLHGSVLSLKPLRRGEGVSYGYAHRAPRDTVVALVAGGYAQGVVRSLGNAASVMIAGERHPIVGRVAMDVCVVDVGEDSGVSRGDEVIYFGGSAAASPALAEWTDASGLTAGELVTAVGLHNDREYVA